MRPFLLAAALLGAAPAAALAQSSSGTAPGAPGAYVPPDRYVPPPGYATPSDNEGGGRRGSLPDTGRSRPRSDRASNIDAADSARAIAPRLPPPRVGEDASGRDFLHDARDALLRGRTGEAQEALERAETRFLDRSVEYNAYREPIHGPRVELVTAARQALGSGDIQGALRAIDQALAGR